MFLVYATLFGKENQAKEYEVAIHGPNVIPHDQARVTANDLAHSFPSRVLWPRQP
jgi:hypothetical protein